MDVPTLTALLVEAEEQHGRYEPDSPEHHWSGWYAAYIVARRGGASAEEAYEAGVRHIATAAAHS